MIGSRLTEGRWGDAGRLCCLDRLRRYRFAAMLIVVAASAGVGGCLTLPGSLTQSGKEATLPVRNTLVREPLVIHSDSDLPERHRVFEDLTAERGDLAERLLLPLSDEPVHVYLFDSATRYEEYVRREFPKLPTRRAFFVETDTELAVYAHWGDRISEDLRHEVAHGYLHAIVPGIPLWIDEGLAEFFEVSRGQRGINRPHLAELVGRLAMGGFRPDLKRLEGLGEADDMTQGDYAESWAWVHWLLESTPQRRALIQGYLAELRRDPKATPLSQRIAAAESGATQSLVDHLYEIATLK